MKILFEARTLVNKAGTAVYAENLLKEMVKKSPNDRFLALVPAGITLNIKSKNLEIKTVPSTPVISRFLWFFYIKSLVNKFNPDIIHFTKGSSINIRNRNVVNTIHDIIPLTHPQFFPLAERLYWKYTIYKALKNSKGIITVSDYSGKCINSLSASKVPVKVIYNGIPSLGSSSKKCTVKGDFFLYVGRIQMRKNPHAIIQAFNLIAHKYPSLKLVIAGSVPREGTFIYKYIDQSPFKDRILITGHLSNSNLLSLYSHAKALIFTSLVEGFGLPIVEAQKIGCPVITSNVASMPDVGGKGAYYADPYNPQDISDKMNDVLTKKVLVRNLISEGKKNIKRFSWEKCAAETLSFYQEIAGKK